MTESTFADLGLSERQLRALREANYSKPTPIQAMAIPELLDGANLPSIALVGTGKIAAFTLLLPDNLEDAGDPPQPKRPQAQILALTGEPVIQISESVQPPGRHTKPCEAVVSGCCQISHKLAS